MLIFFDFSFTKLRNNFFKIIGYNDVQANSPRTHPESITECQRFRAYLRKLDFLNPIETKPEFKSLNGEFELSNQLKDFSNLAKKARQEYIIEVFYKKRTSPSFRPIPVTRQEAIAQENEINMTRIEILRKIESLLEQMNESIRKQYHGIGSKKKSELLIILQEVRNLQSVDNEIDNIDVV